MTVTGASINSKLLAQVKPDVVIVEEAAEVRAQGAGKDSGTLRAST